MNKQISVIIPAYNIQDYISNCLDSLINQTISFCDLVNVIVVNDGSQDNTLEILNEYSSKYSNIQVINQKNQGVSAARNTGLSQVETKYVMFVDGDDYLSNNALEVIVDLLDNKNIGSVVLRDINFEQNYGYGILDYKFTNEIIDVREKFTYIQMRCNQVGFRTELLKNIWFDTDLKYNEDSKFVCEYLLVNPFVYFSKNAYYYYRRRIGDNLSAMQEKEKYVRNLSIVKEKFYQPFLNIDNEYKNYFQYLVMHSLQFKIKNVQEYYNNNYDYVLDLINQIDPKIVFMQKNLPWIAKLKLMELVRKEITFSDNFYYFEDRKMMNLSNIPITIEKTFISDNELYLNLSYFGQEDSILSLFINKKKIEPIKVYKTREFYIFDKICGYRYHVKFKVKLEKENIIKLYINGTYLKKLKTSDFCFIKEINTNYLSENYKISLINSKEIEIIKQKNQFFDKNIQIQKKKLFGSTKTIVLVQQGNTFDYTLMKFYEENKEKEWYYINSRTNYGVKGAIEFGSNEHLELLLNCSYLVVNEPFVNPFYSKINNFSGFFKYKEIFINEYVNYNSDYCINIKPCLLNNSPIIEKKFQFDLNPLNKNVNINAFTKSDYYQSLILNDFIYLNDTMLIYKDVISKDIKLEKFIYTKNNEKDINCIDKNLLDFKKIVK